MKKFFKVLLLAAVALMPVMGMAQTENERDYNWERQMRKRQYEDSVAAARQEQLDKHVREMAEIEQQSQITKIRTIWNEDLWVLFVFAGCTITIVVLCLRHSRRKAEDHKELINKLIDKNLLNSTEPISKEAIEALMKPKKSEKERFIGDATMAGLGMGLIMAGGGSDEDLLAFTTYAGLILLGLGLFRLIIRTISMIIAYIINKKKEAKTEIEEAEIVEEK